MKNDIYNLKAIILIFCAIGLVILYSASSTIASSMFSNYQYFFINQSIRLFIGLIFLLFLSLIDYRIYRKYYKIILYLCWCLIFFRFISIKEARKIIKPSFDKSDVVIIFLPNKIIPLEVGRFCEVK